MTARNLVIQVSVPTGPERNGMLGFSEELYSHSRTSVLQYAQRINSDYLCIATQTLADRGLHPTYERFQVFDEKFDEYDNIAYVDCDVIIKLSAPNIFAAYSGSAFAAFPEGAAMHGNLLEVSPYLGDKPLEHLLRWRVDKGYDKREERLLSRRWLESQYFNAGVFVASRATRVRVRRSGLDAYLRQWPLNDQTALNKLLFDSSVAVSSLSFQFNALLHLFPTSTLPEILARSFFIHFAARTKDLYRVLTSRLGVAWEQFDHDAYSYQEAIDS